MRLRLKLHPESRCDAVDAIEAEVRHAAPGALEVAFLLAGRPDLVRIPPPAAPERTDGLWNHSCFEVFLGGSHGSSYSEFNFSPSGQWAGYRFEAYRTGMTLLCLPPPRIETGRDAGTFRLTAQFRPSLEAGAPVRFGLAAVIEELDGRISYWALAHPPGHPDFHHRDCFAAELSPPVAS